jgi:hypothetical protein
MSPGSSTQSIKDGISNVAFCCLYQPRMLIALYEPCQGLARAIFHSWTPGPTKYAQKAAALASAGAKRPLPDEITVATRESHNTPPCTSCFNCFAFIAFRSTRYHLCKKSSIRADPSCVANSEKVESAALAKRPRVEVGSPVGSLAEMTAGWRSIPAQATQLALATLLMTI